MATILHKIIQSFSHTDTQLSEFREAAPDENVAMSQKTILWALNLAGIPETGKLMLERLRKDGSIRISFTPGTVSCPKCGSRKICKNGYNNYRRDGSILRAIGIEAVLTKYKCRSCKCTEISVTPDDLLPIIQNISALIDKTIVTLREDNMSYDNIAEAIELEFGVRISKSTVARHYKQLLEGALEAAPDAPREPHTGYYSYDEQVLKKNGREVFRLTLLDAVTETLIAEGRSDRVVKTTVEDFLKEHVDGERVRSFVVDGRNTYPGVIRGLFGKETGIQQCITHVMRITSKDYKSAFYNRTFRKKIPFRELYWKQRLFDVFFPRPEILEFVDELRMKENHHELSEEEAKAARKKYYELVKKHRYIASTFLDGYTEKKAKKKFKKILRNIEKYPRRVQTRIKSIHENWKDYTLYLRDKKVPPTNNCIEQYYSRTRQKTQKKRFRSDDSLNAYLRKNNVLKERSLMEFIDQSVSMITLAVILSKIMMMFYPFAGQSL